MKYNAACRIAVGILRPFLLAEMGTESRVSRQNNTFKILLLRQEIGIPLPAIFDDALLCFVVYAHYT